RRYKGRGRAPGGWASTPSASSQPALERSQHRSVRRDGAGGRLGREGTAKSRARSPSGNSGLQMAGGVRCTRKLKQWMVQQVDSNKYPGLVWEDRKLGMFRIPWKHAGKQDYRHDEDAAIFK
ncbi:hypothetical protein scyTo_0023287, partial [Scyliorhinus torazame]|nr:hypothetical protein [Scyliorhinus torazame]